MLKLARTLLGSMLIFCVVAHAGSVNIGLISFDVLTPGGPGSPGVNIFDISNLTGNPSSGGFALPPDFPAFTPLTFLGSTLKLVSGGSTQTINLGTIAPGPVGAISPLEFPATTLFSSATFSATISTSSILLSDGTTFNASSTSIDTVLLPSSGPSLVAGTDVAVIAAANVPEPGTLSLILVGIAALVGLAPKFALLWDFRPPPSRR